MKRKIKLLLIVLVISSTGCYTYQEHCAAYSYEDNAENVETNEENS
jgi:hypothetical protein